MLNTNQETIVDSRVSNIVQKSWQEPSHYLQVGKESHQGSLLYEVVEVSSGVNYS